MSFLENDKQNFGQLIGQLTSRPLRSLFNQNPSSILVLIDVTTRGNKFGGILEYLSKQWFSRHTYFTLGSREGNKTPNLH